MEVLVEYDYTAQNPDEISIAKGDRIKNVMRKEEGWYEGELMSSGKRGLFPDNFVKPIKIPPANLPGKTLAYSANLIKSPEDLRKKKILNGKLISQQPIVVPTSSPPPPPPPSQQQQPPLPIPKPPKQLLSNNVQFKARVLYSYVPVNDDELAIQENEIVQVIRLVEDGWFEGIHAGKQGVFPSNYVERITEQPVPPSAPPAQPVVLNNSLSNESINNSSFIENVEPNEEKKKLNNSTISTNNNNNNNKKVVGIGFGNIFSGKQIELKTKEINNKNVYTTNANNKPVMVAPTVAPIVDTIEKEGPVKKLKAKVLYEYVPAQPDELKLSCGEIIYILDKNLEDEGWWKGETMTGTVGVFPDNFVEEINEPDMAPITPPLPANQASAIKKKLNTSQPLNENHINESASLTNSVSSNSSSSNSLSKSSVNTTGGLNNGQSNGNLSAKPQTTSSFEENNSKSQSDLSEDLEDFHQDANKLTHIKKTKQQNKRPPSFRAKKVLDTGTNLTDETLKPEVVIANTSLTNNVVKKEELLQSVSNSPQPKPNGIMQENFASRQQTPTSPTKTSPLSFNHVPHNTSYLNNSAGANSSSSSGINLTNGHNSSNSMSNQTLIEEISVLKEELDTIRKNSTQMQNDYKGVQNELNELKKSHEEQMKKMQRKLVDLISEIDDEKKTRLALQVELERLKKTITNF